MNDLLHLTVALKVVGPRRQAPPWVEQRTHWNIMRKSTLPELNLGMRYYAHYALKRSEKLSNAASFLKDMKDSGQQICILYTMQRF